MYELINNILNKFEGFDYWFFVSLLIFGFLGWYYLSKTKKFEKKKAKRQIIFVLIILSIGISEIVIHQLFFSPLNKFSDKVTGILILKIEGDDESNSFQRDLISILNFYINKDNNSKYIQILGADKNLGILAGLNDSHNIARKIGKEYNASLVIWGNKIQNDKFHPRITIVKENLDFISDETLLVQNINEIILPKTLISKPLSLAKFILGYNFYIKLNFKKALKYYSEGLEDNKSVLKSAIFHFYMANCYLHLGNKENKLGVQNAISIYNRLIDAGSTGPTIYTNRGAAYLKSKNNVKAKFDFDKAIQLNPYHDKAFYNRGIYFLRIANFDSAIIDFSHSLKINPNHLLSLVSRGFAYLKKNKLDLAIADCNKALKINPNYSLAIGNRGNALYRKGKYILAMQDLNKAIQLDPKNAKFYNTRGAIFGSMAKYDSAIVDFGKSIEIDSMNAETFSNRGAAFLNKQEFYKARFDLNRSIQLDPNSSTTLCNMGVYYFKTNNLDSAILFLSNSIKLDSLNENAYLNRGNSYYKKQLYNNAMNNYQKIIEINPNNPWGYFGKATVFKKLNESKKEITFHLIFLEKISLLEKKLFIDKHNFSMERIKTLQNELRNKK